MYKIIALLFVSVILTSSAGGQQKIPDEVSVDRLSRVYGLSLSGKSTASRPANLTVATPFGLFLVKPEGTAHIIREVNGNLMAFASHPKNRRHLLLGGHPGKSGSIGVFRSKNGGKTWNQISKNGAGHVGFHMLKFSKARPETVYGVTSGLLVSRDGGKNWRPSGKVPEKLITLSTSAKDVKTLYAGTQQGLFITKDAGQSWNRLSSPDGVTSMVHVTPKGKIYVFILGVGLITAHESQMKWKTISNKYDKRVLMQVIEEPGRNQRLFASTLTGAIVTSENGGKSWVSYEGSHNAQPATIAKGEKLFNKYCQGCHGPQAKGQKTAKGFNPKYAPKILAPALDDSDHGWHHSDKNLISTILNGSPREGSPMVAWKSQLSQKDAESLVAYIKSLWSFRSIACQGGRHMSCMGHR